MKKWIVLGIILVLVGGIGYFFWPRKIIDPLANVQFTEKSLEKYDFDAISKRQGVASEIGILGLIKAVEDRRVAVVKAKTGQGKIKYAVPAGRQDFTTREIRFKSDGKWVSGMINYWPEKSSLSKVIIMIRGYAEKDGYYPGYGTWKVADELAKAGYVTISLDFLGYGNSEAESSDVLEARFHKVIEVLDLIQSVKQLPWVDKSKIGIWAHSNGGQIVMSVLEITGEKYPTILWAPMTRSFPNSLIETADPGEDKEKAIAFVNLFEKYYDSRRYAFENYYEWINAPILIQQGTLDSQVKVLWQQEVVDKLNLLNKNVELQIIAGADHNMNGLWAETVERDVEWFNSHFLP